MERWYGRVRVLAADDSDLDAATPITAAPADQDGPVGVLRRGDLATFAEDPNAEVLVTPLMAVERGTTS